MKITFLGTGTSNGVPVIGCECEVCRSTDSRDKRLRSSVLLKFESSDVEQSSSNQSPDAARSSYKLDEDSVLASPTNVGVRILIDCGPDFRQQMLSQPYGPIHALLVTHEHYDHVGGIDDFRPFCVFNTINIYGEPLVVQHLEERLPYCFGAQRYPSAPKLQLNVIMPNTEIDVSGIRIMPLRVMHGRLPILGFRIGRFAYITDMSTMPSETKNQLYDLDLLVVNALRKNPHPTHQSIDEAISLIAELNPKRAYLTHLAHSAGLHAESFFFLPGNIRFAYDGLQLNL